MLLNRQVAAALVGSHDTSPINPVVAAQTYSSRPKKSPGECLETRPSIFTVKSDSDPATCLDAFNAANPSPEGLLLKFKKLQEGSQGLIQELEQLLSAQKIEGEKLQTAQEENIRLRKRIKALEQEAAERSKNMTILSDRLMGLGTDLVIQVRKSDALMKKNKRLESKLAMQIRKNESLNEPMRVQRGRSKIRFQEEGYNLSGEDDDERGDLLEQFRYPAATDQLIPPFGARQPEKRTQTSFIQNTSVIHRDMNKVRALDSWGSLCWKIESFGNFLVGDYLKFICSQPVPIRRAAMSMSALSATTKQVMNKIRVWSSDRSRSTDTRWGPAGSGDGFKKAADTNPLYVRNLKEWLQRISESETAPEFPFFQEVIEAFRTTYSPDDWCILGMVLSYFAQAVIWSVIMDRGVFRTNDKTIVPKTVLPNTVKSMAARFSTRLGLDLCIEAAYLTGLHTEIRGLASEVIRVGQDLHRPPGLWYCEYPRWRSEVVKFDKCTMEENTLITAILPEIGADAVVSSVIRPGLLSISDGNKETEAKCLVILDDFI